LSSAFGVRGNAMRLIRLSNGSRAKPAPKSFWRRRSRDMGQPQTTRPWLRVRLLECRSRGPATTRRLQCDRLRGDGSLRTGAAARPLCSRFRSSRLGRRNGIQDGLRFRASHEFPACRIPVLFGTAVDTALLLPELVGPLADQLFEVISHRNSPSGLRQTTRVRMRKVFARSERRTESVPDSCQSPIIGKSGRSLPACSRIISPPRCTESASAIDDFP
jgi:hypothetical protein